MSELKIAEFRERAESGVRTPDLADIERRGRALRRRRVAATAGGLALVLAAGLGIANGTMDSEAAPDPAAPPSPAPSTSFDDGVRTTLDGAEDVLLPGISRFSLGGVTVRFDVPGENWEWFLDGAMGLRWSAAARDKYGASLFLLPDATARLGPCKADRVRALGADPDELVANVAPLLDLTHSRVLQGPRVVSAFGRDAVHLRLRTNGGCPEGGIGPAQLRGVVNGSDVDPGWSGRLVLDAWHVVIRNADPYPASVLVTSWDLGGTEKHREQLRKMMSSLRFYASEE